MPRKKTRRPSRPVHIARTISVTWNRLSLSARVERTPRGRALGGTEDWEFLSVGGKLDEPIGNQHLAHVSFYVRREQQTPVSSVGILLPGGGAVHIGLDVNERQFDQLAQLAASKSVAEVYVAMDEPRRGRARVESWSVNSLPEEVDETESGPTQSEDP